MTAALLVIPPTLLMLRAPFVLVAATVAMLVVSPAMMLPTLSAADVLVGAKAALLVVLPALLMLKAALALLASMVGAASRRNALRRSCPTL